MVEETDRTPKQLRFALSELSGQTTRPKGEVSKLVGEKKPIWRTAPGDTPGGKWETRFTGIQKHGGQILTVIATQTGASEEEKLDAQRTLGSLRLSPSRA